MSGRAIVRYALGWLAAGLAVAALAVVALNATDAQPERRAARPQDPSGAVLASHCVLRRPGIDAPASTRPPVSGPPAPAAPAGVYVAAPPMRELIGALRRGSVVLQYRRTLSTRVVEALRRGVKAIGTRTILTPDASGMRFVIAITAWGRLLGCDRVDGRVLAALKEFAQRNVGRGPDATG